MPQQKKTTAETAESLATRQREISVSEFFLKNRHLLGFDNPRKALLTTVKEAVDNSLDACEEADILPEIGVDIRQTSESRFTVSVTDNGPGIVRTEIPKIFAKLLYGSKFHRLRMARGQQGIGISAAGMYGQLTAGSSTRILSKTAKGKKAHLIEVQIDTSKNKPTIIKDQETDWLPRFVVPSPPPGGAAPARKRRKPEAGPRHVEFRHGTCVSIDMEAAYVRGKLSVDEYLKQCAIVNPHLQLSYRISLLGREKEPGQEAPEDAKRKGGAKKDAESPAPPLPLPESDAPWVSFTRVRKQLPEQPREIKPHPHGVELGLLTQMLRSSSSRTLRSMLSSDFSRVSSNAADQICKKAGVSPKAGPGRIGPQDIENLYKAINETKLMRPPTDCLSPIGEEEILAGLKKEIQADFYTAVTRPPTVYRGNPFLIEAGIAYLRPGEGSDIAAEDPVRLMRFANRVPLLYMSGACAVQKAVAGVNWRNYGLSQPRDSLPVGPAVIVVHVASVWVPFTSESKEAIAHYPEIIRETTFCLQECGRRLSVFLSRRRRQAEMERKRSYISLYIPHMALGLKQVLDLSGKEESRIRNNLQKLLEKTHLET